jgi:hypothetical protein
MVENLAWRALRLACWLPAMNISARRVPCPGRSASAQAWNSLLSMNPSRLRSIAANHPKLTLSSSAPCLFYQPVLNFRMSRLVTTPSRS